MSASNPVPPASDDRVTLKYSVEGLSAHDALLLKSLVRLLSHRTHQQWSYQLTQAHLQVLGDAQPDGPSTGSAPGGDIPVLLLSHTRQTLGNCLHLPLHVNELEQALNRLGEHILKTGALHLTATEPSGLDSHEYQLRRWPPAALLTTPMRMKLATLLTGRPLSVAALQQRSLQPLHDCAEFFLELRRAGLLQQVAAGHSRPAPDSRPAGPDLAAPTKPPSGLLARIRSRLGLQPTTPP